jgi:hypothetical protein
MVSHLKNWQILGTIVAIFIAGMGTYKGLEEIANKKSVTPTSTDMIPNKITNADTNSTKDTQRYKKVVFDSTKLNN